VTVLVLCAGCAADFAALASGLLAGFVPLPGETTGLLVAGGG
jgi:hypothetical protein